MKMKKPLLAAAAASLLATPALAGKGNGAPTGSHYNLNVIGVDRNQDTPDIAAGRVIFVKLQGNTKIMLIEGDDYQVLDKDGTDGEASFQLPNPDENNDGVTTYSVFARALGKPGGSSRTTTCATDPGDDGIFGTADDTEICSLISLEVGSIRGPTKFENVSKELLYIWYDLDGDGSVDRFPLFDDALEDYFWSYDNNGLRLLQLRFYPCSTDVGDYGDEINDAACFS
jgi:hypothetical protein